MESKETQTGNKQARKFIILALVHNFHLKDFTLVLANVANPTTESHAHHALNHINSTISPQHQGSSLPYVPPIFVVVVSLP